jgi:hypothetical protein
VPPAGAGHPLQERDRDGVSSAQDGPPDESTQALVCEPQFARRLDPGSQTDSPLSPPTSDHADACHENPRSAIDARKQTISLGPSIVSAPSIPWPRWLTRNMATPHREGCLGRSCEGGVPRLTRFRGSTAPPTRAPRVPLGQILPPRRPARLASQCQSRCVAASPRRIITATFLIIVKLLIIFTIPKFTKSPPFARRQVPL